MPASALTGTLGGIALAAAFLAVLLFSRALLHFAGESRRTIAWALAVMLMATVPVTICRVTDNLRVATLITAVFALAGLAFLWRKTPLAPPLAAPPARPFRWAIALSVLAFVLVAIAAIRNFLWDEYSGHFPLSAVIARGVAPPEHPLFPGDAFRYHYAYDALGGLVRAFTGLRVAYAIDVATIASFALLIPCAAHAGARLAGRAGASIAVIAAPFGSGLLEYLLLPELGSFELRWSAIPLEWVQGGVPPPVISNFFQHPQGLAMPISLAVLLLFDSADCSPRGRVARAAIGALLLGTLSLAQLVFFLVLGLALGIAVLARALAERRFAIAALELAFLAASLGIAKVLGGFFASTTAAAPTDFLVFGRGYFRESITAAFLHHLVAFGLPLMLVPFFAIRTRARDPFRVAVLAAVLAGFTIPNVVTYERSWDIVKFFGIGGFFANIALADVLSKQKKLALAALLVISTFVGWFWIARMSILDGELGIPKMHFGPPSAVSDAVADKLDPLVAPRTRVYSTNAEIGMAGGFLTPGFDWRQWGESFMLDRKRCDAMTRHYTLIRRFMRREDLDALDVEWVVLSPGDISSLAEEGRRALEDRTLLEHMFDVDVRGDLRRVYRVIR